MYSPHRHPQQQQQHSSFVDYSSVQQQSQQQQIPVTMTPIPMATPTLDFSLDGSLDQALLDMMNVNTSDLLTMNGFEGSFLFTPECSLDNTTLDNQNNWPLQKEQDWMLTPYNFQQQSSSLPSESLLPLCSPQFQHHFQQQQQQQHHRIHHSHHHYYQHFQQQQGQRQQGQEQQHHQEQQQTQQQQLSHIHPLQTLSPLACNALLTNTNTSSNNSSELFFEESTLIAPQEMLPMDASLASSPTWSSSPASVASSIEDSKPTTPLDTTFNEELIEPRQLELVHRSPSPLPTTIFYDDQVEDEEDYDQDNQSLLLVQQQQQEQEEVELEEEEQEDDEDDNDSDPDWSIGKKPQQQHPRRHVRKNSKTSRGTNKSNKKTCTKKLANHNPHKSSSGRSTPDLTNNSDIRCTNCETQNTPLWRRDSAGEPLCNACGLFLKLHGVVRPLSLKTDVIKKRNRSGHSIHKSPRSRKSRREKK